MKQRKYRQYFNSRLAPTALMIRSLVGRFEVLGLEAGRPGKGAHRNIRIEDNVETVPQSIAGDPSVSTHRRFNQLGISRCTHTKFKLCKHCNRKITCCAKFLANV
ncbi:hypothetical protein TNCV_2918031 [Trichonephila clavipes]|nr:hypothetical protein TNCV_2918031 [Trichonephila clavipes]